MVWLLEVFVWFRIFSWWIWEDNNIDPGIDNVFVHLKYYDVGELQNMKIPNKKKSLGDLKQFLGRTKKNLT